MSEEDAPSPEQPDDWSDACNHEFNQYEDERKQLRQTELDAEKNYGTLLVSLSTLALGFSITILKDFIGTERAKWLWALILGWFGFLACLLLSLLHSKLTYDTHKKWREAIDEEFNTWKPGAMGRALHTYDSIPGINLVTKLKDWGYAALVFGIFFLSLFVLVNYLGSSAPTPPANQSIPSPSYHPLINAPAQNQVINIYGGDRMTPSGSIAIDSFAPIVPASKPTTAPTTKTSGDH